MRAKLSAILGIVFVLSTVTPVSASLVTVKDSGELVVNVLGESDSIELDIPESEYLAVKKVAEGSVKEDTTVSLKKSDGKAVLTVNSSGQKKDLDVSTYTDEIIHLEERPQSKSVTIGLSRDKFTISEKGVVAETDYEITVDPETAKIKLEAPSGVRYLSILPKEALDMLIRTKTIVNLGSDNSVQIKESQGKDLAYEIAGKRYINILGVYSYSIDITANVSASTGELLEVDQPIWVPLYDLVFS